MGRVAEGVGVSVTVAVCVCGGGAHRNYVKQRVGACMTQPHLGQKQIEEWRRLVPNEPGAVNPDPEARRLPVRRDRVDRRHNHPGLDSNALKT